MNKADRQTPLELATTDQLIDELSARCGTLVAAFIKNEDPGLTSTRFFGCLPTALGLATMLRTELGRVARRDEEDD